MTLIPPAIHTASVSRAPPNMACAHARFNLHRLVVGFMVPGIQVYYIVYYPLYSDLYSHDLSLKSNFYLPVASDDGLQARLMQTLPGFSLGCFV